MVDEPGYILRIQDELRKLTERSNIEVHLIQQGGYYVLYKGMETSGGAKGLPTLTDVLVPVPSGYPASQIDMPALPADSPLIPHVVGGSNPQQTLHVNGQQWRVLSYHPYANGGGPPWNPMQHGFHDYYTHIHTWLHRLL